MVITRCARDGTSVTHISYSPGYPVSIILLFCSIWLHLKALLEPRAVSQRAASRAQHRLLAQPAAPGSCTVSSTVLANSLDWFEKSQLQFWEVLQNEFLRGTSLDQRVLTLLFMPDFQQAKMIWNHPHSCWVFFVFFFSCNQNQNTQKETFLSIRHR